MAHALFKNGRDSQTIPAFSLTVGSQVGQFPLAFTGGETVEIPLLATDKFALFLANGSEDFDISNESPMPAVPVAVNGGTAVDTNVVVNPALINLKDSGYESLYVRSANAQTITVLIYGG